MRTNGSVFGFTLGVCIGFASPSFGEESPRADALFALVISLMNGDESLLPKFQTSTAGDMRSVLFGIDEEHNSNFSFRESDWGVAHRWMSDNGSTINLDYQRFIELPPDLEVSYSVRAACPAQPYIETNQYIPQIYGGSVADELVETFAYYYYLERALNVSMGSNNPLDYERRSSMLMDAEVLLNLDWQSFSQEEIWEAMEPFNEALFEKYLNFSHNEFAFQMAERGLPPTFIYIETWSCGGYEAQSYYIEKSQVASRVMIISDLEFEICKALEFDPWSPQQCAAWQPFPDENINVSGWFRVLSLEAGAIVGKGRVRPQLAAFEGRTWENPLRLPIDAVLLPQ